MGEIPPGAGKVVAVQWDLAGDGAFPVTEEVTPAERVRVERRHAFSSPGTHFVTVRVRSERDGDASAVFTRMDNIARVRVVVAGTDGPDAG